jgi:nicotinamide riboside kinase
MIRRIAFAGASGTGKTALATALAQVFRLPLCPVGSRDTAKQMGFDSPYDVDAAGRRAEFQTALRERKAMWEAANTDFVTDRTHADNAVYSMLHDCWKDAQIEVYRLANERYTHIFVCPMSAHWHLGDDPDRVQDELYHRTFESALLSTLPLLTSRAPITIVTPSDFDHRLELVLRVLGG